MSILVDGLLYGWRKNSDYASRLVADLTPEQMILQPTQASNAPVNHPAWILSHLNAYIDVIEALVGGQEFPDPKDHKFGMLSKPAADATLYQDKDSLINYFVNGHERVDKILSGAGDDLLEQEIPIDRWKTVMPRIGIALPYLMLNHENMHLGQISAWRRVLGLPSV